MDLTRESSQIIDLGAPSHGMSLGLFAMSACDRFPTMLYVTHTMWSIHTQPCIVLQIFCEGFHER
jgi:hypothetical protein